MTKPNSPIPAPAVGRGAVEADYYGAPVSLSFSLNTLLAFTEAHSITPTAAVLMLETNALALVRGITHFALRRALRGKEVAPPATEEDTGDWLESLETTGSPAADAIGKAIGAALTIPNPTLAGLQAVIQARVAEMTGTN